jgi:leader peptidase (prepilin peptidase) / N-methyltransferase
MADAVLHVSLVGLALVVTVTDLRSRLIPDLPLLAALTMAISVCAIDHSGSIGGRLLAGAAAGGFLLAAALVRPDGMGLGDVKLAGVLGVYLGARVIEAMVVAFAAGALAGVVVLVRHGWEGRRRTIAFGPFLALGALVAIAPQP